MDKVLKKGMKPEHASKECKNQNLEQIIESFTCLVCYGVAINPVQCGKCH